MPGEHSILIKYKRTVEEKSGTNIYYTKEKIIVNINLKSGKDYKLEAIRSAIDVKFRVYEI